MERYHGTHEDLRPRKGQPTLGGTYLDCATGKKPKISPHASNREKNTRTNTWKQRTKIYKTGNRRHPHTHRGGKHGAPPDFEIRAACYNMRERKKNSPVSDQYSSCAFIAVSQDGARYWHVSSRPSALSRRHAASPYLAQCLCKAPSVSFLHARNVHPYRRNKAA